MQTDKIIYLVVSTESMAFSKRDKWVIFTVKDTREQAEKYIQDTGAKACTVVAEMVENVEQKKKAALSKLSVVEKYLLNIKAE